MSEFSRRMRTMHGEKMLQYQQEDLARIFHADEQLKKLDRRIEWAVWISLSFIAFLIYLAVKT